jgi:Ni,Fe-hydrogenase III large subunit/Ni,Fe-hydrogenase III component G
MGKKHNIAKYIGEGRAIEAHGNLLAFEVSSDDIVSLCRKLHGEHGLALKTLTAFDERGALSGAFKIMYVFGIPKENIFLAPYILTTSAFPSLTPFMHEASVYERKIKTFFGLEPLGHPNPRTIILHENWPEDAYPLRKDFDWRTRPEKAHTPFSFHHVRGEGIYEIPVGPVHAGIIEPGHFRFSVAGEEILLLEPRLGYSHKGTEKLFEVLPLEKKLKLSERISGDSSFAYSLAFSQALETLSDASVGKRARHLRVVFAELERLANHFGDIGLIMQDTGFNLGGAEGGRMREHIMQMHERLTGSRYLRGVNTIGGVTKDIAPESVIRVKEILSALRRDFTRLVAIGENSSSLLNRLKDTGILDPQIAKDHGVTGVPGRALGFSMDARVDYPYAAYAHFKIPVASAETGDVYARYLVRIQEVFSSLGIIEEAFKELDAEKGVKGALASLRKKHGFEKNSYAISVVEGWRGDIVCLVATDREGAITRVDFRDPSFLNWPAIGHAGKGNMVPDFPLINKSFNLSYSGNDL